MNNILLRLEFYGGAELVVGKQHIHQIELPKCENGQKNNWNISKLLLWIQNNLIVEHSDMFMVGKFLRPGIIVLINKVDWELLGHLDYEIEDNDTITFVSTLHGG